jgi:hypothetical protein
MGLHEKIRQVKHEICQNRRETAQVRLDAIAGVDSPYSLLQVFGKGHVITKIGAVAYMTRYHPVEELHIRYEIFLAVRRVSMMTLHECCVDHLFPYYVIGCCVRTKLPPGTRSIGNGLPI